MSKKVKVLIWIVSILLVILIGGAFGANYAIDKVLGTLSTSSVVSDNADDTEQTDNANRVEDTSNAENSNDNNSEAVTQTESESSNSQQQSSTSSNSTHSDTTQQATTSDTPVKTGEVSADKVKELEEDVKLTEKAKAASILLGSLSSSEVNKLKEMASGGITVEEKREAKAILQQKLSAEQYDEILEIAKKYGVSQGKK